ncbi:thioesterase II family protein [Streptomyces enissocaesilis]|uniref:Alpha/beta fold hydrolase n=1 Tax=Streptomyces enissocaesilis TaxID=332589 RepID=A0ABP6J6V5_9ACTN
MGPLGDGLLWELTPEGALPDLAVLLLPGVGGSPADFALWPRYLAPRFRVLSARYPGRSDCPAPAADLTALAGELARRLAHHVPEPLVVFGHSLGALIGYETAWQLTLRRQPPLALHASAALSPPEYGDIDLAVGSMDDPALTRFSGSLGMPLPRDARQRRAALRAIRHDLTLVDSYRHGADRPLTYPLTVWTARDDCLIPSDSATKWQAMSQHKLTHHTLPAEHHYLGLPHAITLIAAHL